MEDNLEFNKYDEFFTSILENEKSILGFLSSIFNFLARRTDFYYVHDGSGSDMGFPPGVAEELVIKVLRKCDPKNWTLDSNTQSDMNNEIMCSTVAQEVEVVSQELEDVSQNVEVVPQEEKVASQENSKNDDYEDVSKPIANLNLNEDTNNKGSSIFPEDYKPPVLYTQKNSESYNGAMTDKYTWSQTIMDLDVVINLPEDIKSSKDLSITLNPGDICVERRNGDTIIHDSMPFKIRTNESFWSISENRLLIHLEKLRERWWHKFLTNEDDIDLSKIDCSRPLDELPEDSIAKVRELQWNQERKIQGLPTSDEMRNIEILKKAWNAEGSPFKGKEFNPDILKK